MSKAQEVWDRVADQMITDIASGTMPWQCPWSKGVGVPVSGVTGRPYRGVNVFILWDEMEKHGWSDFRFFSFDAAKAAAKEGTEGPGVRKGEKAVTVVFNSKTIKLPAPGIKGKMWFAPTSKVLKAAYPGKLPAGTEIVWLEKTFPVFNASQCNGIDPVVVDATIEAEAAKLVQAKAVADACGAAVPTTFGHGSRACYIPALDAVQMPAVEAFVDAEAMYATLFHEYSHASGHASRLDREQMSMFGEEKYAKEELVAESGAAFVLASLGLPYQSQHASYLASWAKAVPVDGEDDRKVVLKRAFAAGQRAADCVLAGLPSKKAVQPAQVAA